VTPAGDWGRTLDAFRESLHTLPQLIGGVSAEPLRRVPAEGEWSAHDVVCHLVLDEMNTTMVLRLMLTEDGPRLPNLDGDNRFCATRFAPLYADTAAAIAVWRALREDNVRLCASASADDLERTGLAPWRSNARVTFQEYVASRVAHDRAHLGQIRSALAD
jgi:hypothetical protein